MRACPARIRPARCGPLAVAIAVLCVCGCAYFNTFYNARTQFRKGEEDRLKATSASAAVGVSAAPGAAAGFPGADSYQRCIDKCQLLLRYYQKSKYVDDALYLIGMSRLYRGEYVQSRAAFEELADRFPKSEYIERGFYYSGMAALRQGDQAGAAQAFEKLATEFPDSEFNVEAIFRSAEARLDERDYETARTALREFMHDHPKSPLAAEAQLRLARTYYEEGRFDEARAEYARVLDMHVTPEARYEAQLNRALAERAQAEDVLANPVLQRQSRMGRGGEMLGPDIAPAPATPARGGPQPPPGGPQHQPESELQPEPEPQSEPEPEQIEQAAAPDSEGQTLPDVEVMPDTSAADSITVAEADTTAPATLSPEDEARLHAAEQSLEEVAASLAALRKPAVKLGRQVDLEIDLAVTRALLGEPREAIRSLDQIARLQPRTEIAARARYEIGEIHRRLGRFEKARAEYEESLKERRGTPYSDLAQRKSTAIASRSQAMERLRDAPRVLDAWSKMRAANTDSLGAQLELQAKFEDLATQQLRVAEIDLLELGQPLVSLDEFQAVLTRFPGSMQSARAAFGIAYVYDHELHDAERARAAYAAVARDYPDTPQGRAAQVRLERSSESGSEGEVQQPSLPR